MKRVKRNQRRSGKSRKPAVKSYSVDRIENGIAVLEDPDNGNPEIEVPLSALPEGLEEGDVIAFDPDQGNWAEDREEKERRLKRNQALMTSILADSKEK